MKQFLVPIDGSEGSNAAIDEALDLARRSAPTSRSRSSASRPRRCSAIRTTSAC